MRVPAPATLVALGFIAVQALFLAVDGRAPSDPGRYYTAVPILVERLGQSPADAMALAMGEVGGPRSLVWAALTRVLGPSVALSKLALLGWAALLATSMAGLSTALLDRRGAAAATALALSAPLWLFYTRYPWVHVPETALLLSAAWAMAVDPRWERGRTGVVVSTSVAIALLIRPSALVWSGALLIPWGYALWRGRRAVAALALLLPALCAAHPILLLPRYLGVKGGMQSMGVHPIGWAAAQLVGALGGAGLVVATIGLVLAIPRARDALKRPIHWALAAWLLAAVAFLLTTPSGARDHMLMLPAIALASGAGLTRIPRGPWLAAFPVALAISATFLPVDALRDAWGRPSVDAAISDWSHAGAGLSATTVGALLDASCPGEAIRSCHVLAPEGLFGHLNEEFGYHELAQLREGRVDLRAMGDLSPPELAQWPLHGMMVWRCPVSRQRTQFQHPDLPKRVADLAQIRGMQPVWSADVNPWCTVHWLVPQPEAWDGPTQRNGTRSWDPERDRAEVEALFAQDEQLRHKIHLPRAIEGQAAPGTAGGRQR